MNKNSSRFDYCSLFHQNVNHIPIIDPETTIYSKIVTHTENKNSLIQHCIKILFAECYI